MIFQYIFLHSKCSMAYQFSSVQSLGGVRLFVTPWTAACQASLSITNSWSLPKPMSIESVMPSNHLILYSPWDSPGQNTGVGSLSLLQGDLPNPGIEPTSLALQGDSLPAEPPEKPPICKPSSCKPSKGVNVRLLTCPVADVSSHVCCAVSRACLLLQVIALLCALLHSNV